ncbi:SPOR domain-containing protein [Alteromonas sp. ASW11-36]|uniref:SPOR domain-containing protein n=1 Tax=Alteromonas arenosi TaxID=3055817 RepID=A0ABT7SVW8_9ALTE|nr:SPOR domain-containing protein [Alteromonas sp. ASW11-36]MDM7860333.1 SPOR domain-containing protein [Alteromonas sp. ASW11-36]
MSSALKNRLVGTIIVVALAVIFLPDLLDGQKADQQVALVSVPEAPVRKPLVQPPTFPTEEVAAAASRPIEIVEEQPVDEVFEEQSDESEQQDTTTPDPADVTSEEADQASLAEQTVIDRPIEDDLQNSGWVIQLGSFRHQKNVRELLDKLENAGYRAFSRPVQTSAGQLTKVFVGPDLERGNLENSLAHLRELTGLSGKITQFKV